MKMLSLLVVAALVAAAPLCRGDSSESAAQAAAVTWLVLVDGGNYYQSWATAAERFRNGISRSDWVQTASHVRDPLGALKSRHLVSATATHALPGAPDGDYVVIRYASSFAAKAAAVETVIPIKEPDGRWRVSGYSIK
ncbi:MAG TPA: DUF4019 domain-containing protein [Steroidobacteraceae bacterium]|nr:DUF4019 domain-containing protein [Steroidobacteraceae bacterium]